MQVRWAILVFLGLWVASRAVAQTLPLCPRVPTSLPPESRPRTECRGPTSRGSEAVPELPADLRAPLLAGCVNTAVGGGVDFVNLRPASRCMGEWRFATLEWHARTLDRAPSRGGPCLDVPARRMELTWEDVVWIARMLDGEATAEVALRDRTTDRVVQEQCDRTLAALVWTAAKRQASLPAYQALPSFSAYIQEFSAPVNPDFLVAGRGGCVDHAIHCTPEKIRERRARRAAPWESLPESARRIALQFALGQLEDPYSQSVDFAGYSTCPERTEELPMSREEIRASSVGGAGRHFFCRPSGGREAPMISWHPPSWLDCSIHAVTAEERARRALRESLSPPCRSCGH